MKTTTKILIAAMFLLAAGANGFFAYSQEYDDVYYSPKKSAKQAKTTSPTTTESPVGNESLLPKQSEDTLAEPQKTEGITEYERYALEKEKEFLGDGKSKKSSVSAKVNQSNDSGKDTLYNEGDMVEGNDPDYSEYYQTDDGGTVVNNYYLDEEDDYDFYYTSRFRRFHSPYFGYSYYDPWFSDMYFYTYDPFYWGTSIYFGNYGGGFGYNDYYSPYSYGWGYSPYFYGSYYSGYYHGYYNDYYGGYWGGSHSDYGNNNYYGHRSSRSGMTRNGSAGYQGISARKANSVNDPRYRTNGSSTDGTRKVYSDDNSRSRSASTRVSGGNENVSRGTSRETVRTNATNVRSSDNQIGSPRQSSTGTYTRPSSRDYTPSYSKPRTSTSPGYNRSQSTYKSTGSDNTGSPGSSNTYTRPTEYNRSSGSSSSGTRSSSGSGSSYSRPSNPNPSYSRSSSSGSSSSGSSSYSQPSRSSSSSDYSSPSRSSSPSYSSPSRSSSSSYSSGSSSSGSRSSYSSGSSSSGSSSSGSRSVGSSGSSGSSRSSSSSSGSRR